MGVGDQPHAEWWSPRQQTGLVAYTELKHDKTQRFCVYLQHDDDGLVPVYVNGTFYHYFYDAWIQ